MTSPYLLLLNLITSFPTGQPFNETHFADAFGLQRSDGSIIIFQLSQDQHPHL